jgi:hypothetical protein
LAVGASARVHIAQLVIGVPERKPHATDSPAIQTCVRYGGIFQHAPANHP